MSAVPRSLAAASLAAICSLPLAAQPRTQQPGPNTPRLLVATFRGLNDGPRLGVDGAEALRNRMQRERSPRDVWVVPRTEMNRFLQGSGFPDDTTLNLEELKQLAQTFRADAIVDGVVTKTAAGVSVEARLILPSNTGLVQPLGVVVARTLDDAAKELERSIAAAQKSVADFRRCANAISAQKYDEARAAARQAIERYPQSTLSRLCLMDAFSREQQASPDSVIAAARAVLERDSTSVLALTNLVDSYRALHDTANTVIALLKLVVYRPDLRPELIGVLGQMNQPKVALPIIDQMLRENPEDPALLRQRWLLLLANKQWAAARAAGDALVKADSSAATADYFTRSIAAASADSQPALAAEIATRAVTKYPKDASLWALAAQMQRKAGQAEIAVHSMQRALALDASVENGWPFLVVAQIELGQVDSAFASARAGIAARADREALGKALAIPAGMAAKRADAEKTRSRWLEAYALASRADSVASTAHSKFYLGLAAFQIGFDALQKPSATNRCGEATLAEAMWAEASIDMPIAARAGDDERRTATAVLSAIQKYSPAITEAKQSACRARRR